MFLRTGRPWWVDIRRGLAPKHARIVGPRLSGTRSAPFFSRPRRMLFHNFVCSQVCGEADCVHWSSPAIAIPIPNGSACVEPFDTSHTCSAQCRIGWFFPVAALERI